MDDRKRSYRHFRLDSTARLLTLYDQQGRQLFS
jgi:hypothetical protein